MSLLAQFAVRRVPQILGLYIAGTWMAIEIGDWLIEKFGLPDRLTAYIFVGLAALLPSIALFAWNHGAPGRDRWTRSEKVVLPLNALGAAAALLLIGPGTPGVPPVAEAATTTMTMLDETGTEQTFEVPVGQYHKRITVFFLSDDLADDDPERWLAYGLPHLVQHDLNHETPLATARTPFASDSLKQQLQERGFADLRGEPRALQLDAARQRNAAALLSGRLTRTPDGSLQLQTRLVDVAAGTEFWSDTVVVDDAIAVADAISQRVQNALNIDPKSELENDPLRDNYSSSLAAIEQAVESRRLVELNNDYPAAAARAREAIALDSSFAEVYGALADIAFLTGDTETALARIDEALQHDYKLSTGSRFLFKTRRYIYANNYLRGIEVLELWSKVQPQNPLPFTLRGKLLALTGQSHDEAIEVLSTALELDPADASLLEQMARTEQSRGEYATAAQYAQRYLDSRPQDSAAHELLASVYLAATDFERAEASYLNAELLAAGDLGPTLGLASLDVRRGQLAAASERIESALSRNLSPQQRAEALTAQSELAHASGRMALRLEILDALDTEWEKFMPPILRYIQVGLGRADTRALLGDYEEALEQIDTVRAQLQPPLDEFLNMPLMGALWRQGQRDEAMAALERAEAFADKRLDPGYTVMIEYGRSFRFAHAQDVQGTVAQVKKANELLGRSLINTAESAIFTLELQVDLARLLHDVGAIDDAQSLLARVLERAPFLATAHALRARILFELERLAEAQNALTTALDIWSQADERYVHFAAARELQAQLTP